MGGSVSKATRAAPKKYPKTFPSIPPRILPVSDLQTPPLADRLETQPPASSQKNESIKQDGFDPQLAANLRHLGAVHPLPTVSYTSTAASSELTSNMEIRPLSYGPSSNPAIRLLEAREVLAQRAEQELSDVGRKGFKGREFADVITLKKIIALRDESSKSPKQIERQLGLKSGVVEKLGSKGLVGAL